MWFCAKILVGPLPHLPYFRGILFDLVDKKGAESLISQNSAKSPLNSSASHSVWESMNLSNEHMMKSIASNKFLFCSVVFLHLNCANRVCFCCQLTIFVVAKHKLDNKSLSSQVVYVYCSSR